MTAEEKLRELTSTEGTTKIPWDDLWDFSLYTKTQVKRVVTRYRIVAGETE